MLAVERQGIHVFGGGHIGQQAGTGQGFRDGLGRHGRLGHAPCLAARAGIPGADVAQDLDLGGNDVELLADVLADGGHFTTAAGALFLGVRHLVNDVHPREIIGQRATPGPLAGMGRYRNGLIGRCLIGAIRLRLGLVEEPELVGRGLLAGGGEAFGDGEVQLLAQVGDVGIALPQGMVFFLERGGVL